MILAGDIGGTKTVLALFEEKGAELTELRTATYPSKAHATFQEILHKFLQDGPAVTLRSGCFGVAGAVVEGKCRTTNLPWVLDEPDLAQTIGALRVRLLNDLEAAAYGMLFLRSDEIAVINPGTQPKPRGNIAVIAAGTGLGEAMLCWDGERHHPVPSEGGHVDFAPRTDQEIELLKYLRVKYGGRVSYERVLSGPGFFNIYTFLRDTGCFPAPPWLTEKLTTGDPSFIVTQVALAGQDPLCVATLDLFCMLYGAEAGNLALKCLAVGGVFVGGGIAPKIGAQVLRQGGFLRGFTDKGRFSDFMKGLEVNVALNPRAPLLGAAHFAQRL